MMFDMPSGLLCCLAFAQSNAVSKGGAAGPLPDVLEQRRKQDTSTPADFGETLIEPFLDSRVGQGFFQQMQADSLVTRFVQWNTSGLARGQMSASFIPGPARVFPDDITDIYYGGQGLLAQFQYKGIPMMKMVWDLALYQMLLWELKPKTVIELGSGSGASAVWFADQASVLGVPFQVHSFDINDFKPQELNSPSNAHFHVANTCNVDKAIPGSWLRDMPHPWVIIEDAHVNIVNVAAHFFQYMNVGDYFIAEDTSAMTKRHDWFQFLEHCGYQCLLDLKYADYFGINLCAACDGWMVKAEDPVCASCRQDVCMETDCLDPDGRVDARDPAGM
eukprot:gnl/TRDRNA2_/TRDRNA2_172457_c18_seq2.p1 gnl/TRDRNA2_/TRDRNA2_172457_c18~~gnl/TRDRNA2_/TRDRNA2_172457_c18_seq2.p1  ORF type:complete len:333 (-),score=35.48 gnl/TRDRNA2_/TRDRNA2_172457_c18_seq2:231-1229(-)